jgi:hypothetical protein
LRAVENALGGIHPLENVSIKKQTSNEIPIKINIE